MMKKNNVDYSFQFRIRKYNEYIFREESDYVKEQAILNKFSKPIKQEFLSQIYGKMINSIKFLSKNFSKEFLSDLLFLIKKIDFAPEETIIKVFNNFYVFIFIEQRS